MGINRILNGLTGVCGNGEKKPLPPGATTPTFAEPMTELDTATKRGEQQVYGDHRRQMIEALWAQQAQAAHNSVEFKPVTKEQVSSVMLPNVPRASREEFNKNLEDYTTRLNDAMKASGINKPIEQAMFLATVSEESRGMTSLTEEKSKALE